MKIENPAVLSAGVGQRLSGAMRGAQLISPVRRLPQVILLVVLLLVAGGAGTNLVMRYVDKLPAGVVFRVDGVSTTNQQLQHRVALMEFLYGLQQPTEKAKLGQFNRDVAKALAVSQVIDKAAREKDIVIADKAANDQLQKLIKENSWKDRSSLIRELGGHGLSETDVIDEVKRQQASARLFAKVTGSVKASTEADARRYYDQNKRQMVSPEQRSIDNIVVSSQEQAQKIAKMARSGDNFGSLAKQYSIDGSTNGHGGSLGSVTARQLDAGYAEVAFKASPDSVFGPVQTKQGWNVGRVADIHKAVDLSFNSVKSAIRVKLDNDAKIKAWNAFLKRKVMAAHVVYAPSYRPADPNSPPKTVTGG
ncbi:foldase protein PrsA [Streptomyces lydicus]|uniref:foldase protein PrsA n=1 Tax=Streptomyces lydicus TaxID=47763 RepID=UPI003426A595